MNSLRKIQEYYLNHNKKLECKIGSRIINVDPYGYVRFCFKMKPIGHLKHYPIKALYILGSNLLLTSSNPTRIAEALKKIDLVVAVDLFHTPTTQLADLVLPAASWLEIDDVAEMHILWCNPIRQKVAQIGECWDDKKIMAEICKRLGRDDFFPWKDDEEYCNWILKDTGITFDELKEAGIHPI